jgi:hypothetical protein
MKVGVLVILMAFGMTTLLAQEVTQWHVGSVALQNDQLLMGEISFQTTQFVLFKSDEKITVYPAFKVRWFKFFDDHAGFDRKFISINQRYNSHAIYEMVLWGKVNVVRELKAPNLENRVTSHVNDYNYFTYDNGRLTRLKKFKRDVYPALTSRIDALPELVKQARLNPDSEADAIQIAQLYNELSRERIMASNNK